MPTVSEYRTKLDKAMLAGDQPAVEYFQSQIAKGEAMPMPDAQPTEVPQGGSLASPIAQGVTFGFADEIGGGLSAALAGLRGEDMGDTYTKSRDDYREAASQYEQRHPYVSLGTEIGSGMVLPGGVGKNLARGLMAGAAAGGLTAAGKNEGNEHVLSDVLAGAGLGAGGAGIAQGLAGLYRAIVPRISPRAAGRNYAEDVRALEQAGIPVTPAERLGQPGARAAEKQTAAYLASGEEVASRPNQLRSQIMARGGFDPEDVASGELSDSALHAAQDRLSDAYDRILTGHTVNLQDMDPALAAIERRFQTQMLKHEQKREVRRVLDSFRDEIANHQNVGPGGQITTNIAGEAYKRMSSNLGKTQRRLAKQTGENASLAPLYGDIKAALDDAFRASAPPALSRALRATDRQYAHYAFLRDVATDPENINNIANRVNQSNVDRDLKRLARAYQNVIVRSGGEGAAEASGNVVPPVLAMAKAAGARASAGSPQLPRLPGPLQPLARHMQGTGAFGYGQASGIAASNAMETGNDTKRKKQRRDRYAPGRSDY